MRLAHWVPCDPPSEASRAGMIQLCELNTADEEDLGPVTEIFIHIPLQYALMCEDGKVWHTADLREEVPWLRG